MLDFVFENTANVYKSGSFTQTQISGNFKAVNAQEYGSCPETSKRNRNNETSHEGDISHLIASRLEVMLRVS
ncbi:MAG: hypothetical protein AB2L14_01395 [Candidatus Xenobiia bacterium LiM19]